ncbi:polysaccharide biosynthesis tyrosine autokinase [Williamsia sp. SKLECPSW1]
MTNGQRQRADPRDGVHEALSALRRGWLVVLIVGVIVGAAALAFSLAQTPMYAATATLYVTSGSDDNSNAAYVGGQAAQQRVASYTKLVNSDAVLDQALSSAKLQISTSDARKALSSSSSTSTVLLSITATESSRSSASDLANAVARSMTAYIQRLETPAGGGQPLAKLTLVTPAVASSTPVSPKTTRNVLLGLFVGAAMGAIWVLARSRFNNRVRSEEDLATVSESPVLGVVPTDSSLRKQGLIDFASGATPAAEAYRKLRTNLSFTSVDKPASIILVTSPMAVEGKTTTAMNLAAALAEVGHKVVLVDSDLRRPQVDRRSGLIGGVGLTNFLRGDADLEDLVQESKMANLWMLASGPQPPNPAELLATERARNALKRLADSFDLVIVDSPPVLPVTDAAILSGYVDAVLLVARARATKVRDLQSAIEQLGVAQTPVIGTVLTEADVRSARYTYYGQRLGPGKRPRSQAVVETALASDAAQHRADSH